MTQADLASRITSPAGGGPDTAPLTRAAIAQYETSAATPGASVLHQLHRILRVEPGFFSRPIDGSELPASFRSLRSAPAAERKHALRTAQLVHDAATALSMAVKFPQWPAIHRELAPGLTPEKAAREARGAWRVPDGPVDDVVLALERVGCVVAVTPDTGPSVDAFSVPFEPAPVIMLSSFKNKRDRSRFDAAHEAAHLVLHRGSAKTIAELEAEAHAFAAAFLMPAEHIRDELPTKVDWAELAHLKQRWQVSIAALLKRAADLERIRPEQYTSAMKYMSLRGWRRHEPVDLGPCEQPSLLRKALAESGLGVPGLASSLRVHPDELYWLLGATTDERPTVRP